MDRLDMSNKKLSNKIKQQIKSILKDNSKVSIIEPQKLIKFIESSNGNTLKRVERILIRLLVGNVYWHEPDGCNECFTGTFVDGKCNSCDNIAHPGWVNVRTNAEVKPNVVTAMYKVNQVVDDSRIDLNVIYNRFQHGDYRLLYQDYFKWLIRFFPAIGDLPIDKNSLGLVNRLSNRCIPFDHIPANDLLYLHILARDLLIDNPTRWSTRNEVIGDNYVVNKRWASKNVGRTNRQRFSVFNDTHYNKILRRAGHTVN